MNKDSQSHILRLFYLTSCPYCQRVLQEIKHLDIDLEYCDVGKNSLFHDELFNDTGRMTVPCLYIDGKPMHESSDIIHWLKAHYKQKIN